MVRNEPTLLAPDGLEPLQFTPGPDAGKLKDQAVDSLRAAGTEDLLARGLLARAALRRFMGDIERARADLDEAADIAERGGMRLHQADCHLGYARLHLAIGERDQAREHLATAKTMFEEMGYYRRDGEVAELEEALGGA